MVITRKRNKDCGLIYVDEHLIEQVTVFKYLGVLIDHNLKFNNFAQNQETQAQKSLNIIRSLCGTNWGSHPQTLINLYKSMVRSHLEYGCFLYNVEKNAPWAGFDRIQAKAAKACLGLMKSSANCFALFESAIPLCN